MPVHAVSAEVKAVVPGSAVVTVSQAQLFEPGGSSDPYNFPGRIRPIESGRKLVRVRNLGSNALQLAYGSGANNSSYNAGTWAFVVPAGQEWVDTSGASQGIFMRPNVSGESILASVYVECAVA